MVPYQYNRGKLSFAAMVVVVVVVVVCGCGCGCGGCGGGGGGGGGGVSTIWYGTIPYTVMVCVCVVGMVAYGTIWYGTHANDGLTWAKFSVTENVAQTQYSILVQFF